MHNHKLTAAICLALATPSIYASGFSLIEQSASGQGLSYAGAAANAEDASVMWFNAAALTKIEGSQAIGGIHLIVPQSDFTNSGSVPGGVDDNGATNGVVPNLYWKGDYNGYALGFGINAPFGQKIDYADDWAGRYQALETDLKSVNINANIARQINDQVSIGFGLNAQYVNLNMSQFYKAAPNLTAKIEADSWGYGYNLGLLANLTEQTVLGLSYRSEITHNAKGSGEFEGVATVGASSDVTLPASAMLSLSHQANDKITVLADATWTGWKAYDELVIEFDSLFPDSETNQEFKDSMRYSLGMMYDLNDQWTLRTGVALDETPVPDAEARSPRTPDSNRTWLSAGFNYKLNSAMSIDMGYTHIIGDKADINRNDGTTLLKGSYDSTIDIISAQLVWNY